MDINLPSSFFGFKFRTSLFLIFVLSSSIGHAQLNIAALATPVTQNFDGMGNLSNATIASGFVVSAGTVYSAGTTTTDFAEGTIGANILTTFSTGGTYNFANGITASATDRSLGFLNTGAFSSPRSIMLELTNTTGSTITSIIVSFDYEKYRSGSRAFDWTFFHGNDGSNWSTEANGNQLYIADANNSTVSNPPTTTTKSFTINDVIIPSGTSYYLRWTLTGNGGSSNGQAIGIDNFSITANSSAFTTSSATDYFRSRKTGDWGTYNTWESSTDNLSWHLATLAPTSAANSITILSGHIVTIVTSTSADQLTISSGATLVHNNGIVFTLSDGTGTDMTVFGIFALNGSIPTYGSATFSIESGGIVRASSNAAPSLSDDFVHANANILFKTGSVFDWATTSFTASGVIYFNSAVERPTFRVSASVLIGAGSNTTVNGFLDVAPSVTLTIQNAGIRIFRDGFGGDGNINLTAGSIQITGTDISTTKISGTGITTISGTSTGIQIANLAQVSLNSNYVVNGVGFAFTINSGGRLNCGTNVLSGSSNFVLASGGTLGIGSTAGINSAGATGNIQTTGRSFNSGANYIYNNGTDDQSTGTFTTTTPNTVNSVSISNTGFTVTLSVGNNNLTATSLNLNSGNFATGTGQNLNIANGGSVNGNGGTQPSNATAGTITFIGGAGVSYTNGNSPGEPKLYSVILNGGVDFNGNPNTNSGTIIGSLQLNSGSYISNDAPFYQSESTLIYNTGGTYSRNVEWGSASGQGFPHHVKVQGNTTLNLNTNPITPLQLVIAGNLTLGNASSWGIVNLNGTMNKALSVGGNLEIGNNNAAANTSALNLSTTIGGDLWLYGNFTRWNGSFYNDNSRAIFFKGTADATINTPNVTITAGVPSQYFSYALLDKSAGTEKITLNCPVGINNQITFTKGIVTSTSDNLLVLVNGAAVAGTPGTLSFVNGPMRKIGNALFTFPVGKLVGITATPHYRTIGISAPGSATDAFDAEFFRANATLLGTVETPLVRVSQCEFWTLDRPSGSADVYVTLSWSNQSPCTVAYVTNLATLVVAHNGSSLWTTRGNSATTGDVTAGTITSLSAISTFSPFSLGSINQADNPLPFKLTSFTVTPKQQTVLINWVVANNNEQQEYILERSKDAIHFETTTTVTAKTNSVIADYTYIDEQPFNGWNYYRLRAKDHQNKTQTSSIIKVWMGKGSFISVLPNPASEKIVINLSEPSSILQMQIVNTTGQVLRQLNTIQFLNEINISNLQAGMYYIRFLGKDGVTTKSFVKH